MTHCYACNCCVSCSSKSNEESQTKTHAANSVWCTDKNCYEDIMIASLEEHEHKQEQSERDLNKYVNKGADTK